MCIFTRNLFSFFGGFLVTEQEAEFAVSGFKARKHGSRSDKGKRHVYPEGGKSWCLFGVLCFCGVGFFVFGLFVASLILCGPYL
jgi:hypothetical protein